MKSKSRKAIVRRMIASAAPADSNKDYVKTKGRKLGATTDTMIGLSVHKYTVRKELAKFKEITRQNMASLIKEFQTQTFDIQVEDTHLRKRLFEESSERQRLEQVVSGRKGPQCVTCGYKRSDEDSKVTEVYINLINQFQLRPIRDEETLRTGSGTDAKVSKPRSY